jgi:hypothetical protein
MSKLWTSWVATLPLLGGIGLFARPGAVPSSVAGSAPAAPVAAPAAEIVDDKREVRDVGYFLRRLRTVDHLPELEDSHTSLASTWDRSGGNADGTDYKRIEGTTNVLLDAEGPGCIHRLFTGGSEPGRDDLPDYLRVDGTRLQVFLDDDAVPVFDYPVVDFFDPGKGPVPAPLAGGKAQGWTYPGSLLPIPYARHCRVQLINPARKNWGCYWQIAYTSYPRGTPVESLVWPMPTSAQAELEAVRRTWWEAQSAPPAPPGKWILTRSTALRPCLQRTRRPVQHVAARRHG